MTGFRSLGDEETVEFECKPSDKGLEATGKAHQMIKTIIFILLERIFELRLQRISVFRIWKRMMYSSHRPRWIGMQGISPKTISQEESQENQVDRVIHGRMCMGRKSWRELGLLMHEPSPKSYEKVI